MRPRAPVAASSARAECRNSFMENKAAGTACAVSFGAGVLVGFSLNRWMRNLLKKLEKDL